MKNYTMNNEDAKCFIENYDKDTELITINYASGDSLKVPNTKENEIKIQDKMKKQLEDTEEMEERYEDCLGVKGKFLLCGIIYFYQLMSCY